MPDETITTKTKKSRPVEVFVNETDHECTLIKVIGPDHEQVATKLVRKFHGTNY